MWIVTVSLLMLWMLCALLGTTCFGLTHLLGVGAIAIEALHRPARAAGPRRP
jgi:hypothetical protein